APATAYTGTDSFTYFAQDSWGHSVAAKVALNIAPLALHATTGLQVSKRTDLSAVLATVTLASGYSAATPLTATVAWGDGQTSAASVTSATSGFQIQGVHSYSSSGVYSAAITLQDAHGTTSTNTASITVTDTPPQLVMTPNLSAFKGLALQPTLATFSDHSGATPSQFTAMVDWGDGHQSVVTIVNYAAGAFAVTGGHLY